MSRFKKKKQDGVPAISTASLPDIVFMLLFFFMVSTVMKDNDLMIVSKDADMHDLSLVFGNPPKVIWLRLGNCSTLQVENLLRREFSTIKLFYEDKNSSLLALS